MVIGSGVRWGTMFKLMPDRPEFGPYVARISARDAAKRAHEKDETLKAA